MKINKMRMFLSAFFVATLLVAVPVTAYAHVTVEPSTASKGGYGNFTVKVPSHDDVQNTVKVELAIPQDEAITSVQVAPTQGWTFRFEKTKLDNPVDNHGAKVTEVISKIIWEGGQVKPNEFVEFRIALGPLPENLDSLMLPVIQTYDGGKVANWIEETIEGEGEPESPAPVISLLKSEDGHNSSAGMESAEGSEVSQKSESNTLEAVAIGIAILALIVAIAAYFNKKS